MYGKIKSIEVVEDLKIDYYKMDGYKVETDKHIFYILIYNEQCCCEDFGYFASEDDLAQFIGNEVLEVRTTDTELKGKSMKFLSDNYISESSVQFVDFVTNKGVLQFAVYNEHNGYYGHDILILCDQEELLSDVL